jgi:hypothetical protein
VGSILDVRSSGLGSATREVKRHSRVKVPKVSHTVRKVKRKWGSHKPKEIDLRPKKKVEPKRKVEQKKVTKQPIKHTNMKVTVTKKIATKQRGYKSDKKGNIYYD